MFKNKNKVECEQWRYLLKVTKPAFAGFVDQFDAIDDSLDLGKLREKKINISGNIGWAEQMLLITLLTNKK